MFISKAILYLCHVDLMAGELTDLESRCVACHQDVVVGPTFNDDLRLVGGRAGLISGLVVHCVLQLATVRCYLKSGSSKKTVGDNSNKCTALLQTL